MNELMQKWLDSHPGATAAEAYKAGYLQAVDVYVRAMRNMNDKNNGRQ